MKSNETEHKKWRSKKRRKTYLLLVAIVDVAIPILVGYAFEVVHVVLCWKREKQISVHASTAALQGKAALSGSCDLEPQSSNNLCVYVLCEIKKEAENKFPESL